MPINQNMDINSNSKCEVKINNKGETTVYVIDEIPVDKNNFEQRVKVLAIIRGKTLGEISNKFGVTQASFFSRCRTGKLNFNEKRKLAEILQCKMVIKFVFEDEKGIVEFKADNIRELVSQACNYVSMTQTELGEKFGKSRQNFSSKLINGRFTDDEINELAEKIGCKYINYFELEDGTQI